MKLKKLILLTLITIISISSFGQSYVKTLSNVNKWSLFYSFESAWTTQYQTIGDTLLFGKTYRQVYYGIGGLNMQKSYFLIREDTVNRKIYIVPRISLLYDTTEYLVYDFSKGVGDTITVFQPYYAFKDASSAFSFVIDSISFLPNITNYPVFYLSNVIPNTYPYYLVWVEGIGSMAGIENNCSMWNYAEINSLICAYQDTVQTLYYIPQMQQAHNCDIGWINIETENINMVKINPNPTFDKITITGIKKALTLKLFTSCGIKIKDFIIENNEVNLTELKAGIYIVMLYDNNVLIARQKLVKY